MHNDHGFVQYTHAHLHQGSSRHPVTGGNINNSSGTGQSRSGHTGKFCGPGPANQKPLPMSIQRSGLPALRPQISSYSGAQAGASQASRRSPIPSPQPDSQPPSQQAAYIPQDTWSAEWMEQHLNPDFKGTLKVLLDTGYCLPEELRDVQRGSHNFSLVWPEGAGPHPVPIGLVLKIGAKTLITLANRFFYWRLESEKT
eukprot:27502-Pelagomonas_calceolata.AAC.1